MTKDDDLRGENEALREENQRLRAREPYEFNPGKKLREGIAESHRRLGIGSPDRREEAGDDG